jgi:steroid delta-isomerase-like uncharacterized protein
VTRNDIAALLARRQEAANRHDIPALMADYADDCVLISPMAGEVAGREAIERVYRTWYTAFPDALIRHESLLVDGDQVAEMETISGTDTGGFMGLDPTRKSFEVPVVRFYTFRDGVIVYERRVYDFTGMLVQIGVLKAKPA